MKIKKNTFLIIISFVIWRVCLELLGKISDFILPYDPSFPYAFSRLTLLNLPRWVYSWVNFDGVHYLTIASEGYLHAAAVQAFFPIFPIIIRLMMVLNRGSAVINGLLITTLCALFFFLYLSKYLKAKLDIALVNRTHIIFLLFPFSFFLIALYTESLFLLLLMLSLSAFRKKQYGLVGLLIALTSATRLVGIFLVPAFLLELYIGDQKSIVGLFSRSYFLRKLQKQWKNMLKIFFGIIGLGSYMFYLWYHFHDPIYFFHVQSEFGAGRQERIILLPQVIWRYLKIFWTVRPFDLKYFVYLQEFIISIFFGIILLWGWLKKGYYKLSISELTFASFAFILPSLTGSFSSMPRYVLVCFPVFVIFANHLKGWKLDLYLIISVVLLFFNSIMFLQGYWVA